MTYQTGTDESYLIGTKQQLLSFANSIISAVETAKSEEFFNENILSSKSIYGSLDSKSEIQLDEVIVVENDEQKDIIFYKIYNS